MKSTEIYILNGPNLNMLGLVDLEHMGQETLEELNKRLLLTTKELGIKSKLKFFQTNSEAEFLDFVHKLVLGSANKGLVSGIILNLGAWAYTSVAIREAIAMLKPTQMVEVVLSSPEPEQTSAEEEVSMAPASLVADLVDYRVVGLGGNGYIEALRWLVSDSKKERLDVH